MAKNGGNWIWKHRYGISRASMAAGMYGGGVLGLVGATTFRFAGGGMFFLPAGTMAGTLGAYSLSQKLTGHFKPRQTKRAFAIKQPRITRMIRPQRSIFQIG